MLLKTKHKQHVDALQERMMQDRMNMHTRDESNQMHNCMVKN
jgi:hypothetical protein